MTTHAVQHRIEPAQPFAVAPCRAALGAEIRGIDLNTISDATFKAIHKVTNVKENGKAVGILGDGGIVWHCCVSC